jgi:hypothetical protein
MLGTQHSEMTQEKKEYCDKTETHDIVDAFKRAEINAIAEEKLQDAMAKARKDGIINFWCCIKGRY